MRIFEESKELEWAMTIINRCIRRGAMVRLVDRSNPDFSVKLDREMDLVIADMINNDTKEIFEYGFNTGHFA